jgi:integrase
MRRSKTKERARTRILTDNEIRTIWRKAEGAFGDLLRLLLLTGQRRDKVASMKWEDISVDGVWSIPNGHRKQKGTGGDLKLPKMALDIIRARPRLVSNPHVFPAARTSYFRLYATGKEAIDAATGISGWRLHDFRRTSRSMMARAGIASEVAEQVLGHSLAGVERVYNRHRYTEEKAHALRSLADLIDSIINPRSKKVIRLSRKR